MSRLRSNSEARSKAPAHREPSVTSIDNSSGVNSRSSLNVKTSEPMIRFMICRGTPTAPPSGPRRSGSATTTEPASIARWATPSSISRCVMFVVAVASFAVSSPSSSSKKTAAPDRPEAGFDPCVSTSCTILDVVATAAIRPLTC